VTSILEIRNAEVRYGKIAAVRDLNIRIDAGQTVTIIGANGAGKSTLLNSIAGLLPASGEYFYDGKSLAGTDTEARIEQGLCLVPERRELFSTMTVEDNAVTLRRAAHSCSWCIGASLSLPNAAIKWLALCRVASARCWRSAAR
jgi:ABC-type branched-subunit amino acid transport system ATPase component